MALVRCSCVADLIRESPGTVALAVHVLDPHCDYVVHRLAAEMETGPAPDGVRR